MLNQKIEPVITEASLSLAGRHWYTFRIPVDLDKPQIAKIVADLFKVKVLSVRTINVKGKSRRSMRSRKTVAGQNWKKALIRLKDSDKIDLFTVTQEQ